MFKRIATAAVVFGMAALAPPVAEAQTFCAPRDVVIKHLEGKYGEVRQGAGLHDSATVFELWSSEKTGSWTIMLTRTDGVTCVVASGEAWMDSAEADLAKSDDPGA